MVADILNEFYAWTNAFICFIAVPMGIIFLGLLALKNSLFADKKTVSYIAKEPAVIQEVLKNFHAQEEIKLRQEGLDKERQNKGE